MIKGMSEFIISSQKAKFIDVPAACNRTITMSVSDETELRILVQLLHQT